MDRFLIELLLFASPFILGIALIILARWARQGNADLKNHHGGLVRVTDGFEALTQGDIRRGVRLYFFGSMPRFYEHLGKFLAVLTVLAVLGTLALILFLLYTRTSS
jgi:hypothetical protein